MIAGATLNADTRGTWAWNAGQGGVQASSQNADNGRVAESMARSRRSGPATTSASKELTPDELRVVRQLEQTDRQVRAHEQAHLSVGADLVRGGPTYSYEVGPDDKRYAVGGEVSIDASPARTPEATIPKAQHIRSTALAPADPSAQDYRVAAAASQMEINARMELAQQRSEEIRSARSETDNAAPDRAYRHDSVSDSSSASVGGFLDAFA